MRRHLPPLAVLVAALAGCGGGSQTAAPQQGGPMPAPVAAVVERELPVERELTGRVESIEYVELRPRVGGLVEKVLVKDGAEVKAGDVILQIDEAPLRATVARADADLARAESRAALAKLQLQRADQLLQQKVIAPQQHDDLAAAVRTADADVAAAKATLETARLDLGYAKVTAPIDGRIGKVLTTAGNLLQGGGPVPATLLTTIVSVDPVDVVFDLDEEAWRRLGDRLRAAQAGHGDVPVRVGIAGEDGFPHAGTVRFVDNRIDTASGAIRIRAKVENKDRVLTPGAFARVRLQMAPPKPCVLVNEGAVKTNLSTRFVMVVDDQNIAHVRPIELGANDGGLRVVTDGLKAGDRITVGGMVMPESAVTPIPASMETLQPLPPNAPATAKPQLPPELKRLIESPDDPEAMKAAEGKAIEMVASLPDDERSELSYTYGRGIGRLVRKQGGDLATFIAELDAAAASNGSPANAAGAGAADPLDLVAKETASFVSRAHLDRAKLTSGLTEGFASVQGAAGGAAEKTKAEAADSAKPAAGANRANAAPGNH